MKARISQLHKTEAEWNELGSFVPEAGELIVYDPDKQHTYARLKIGDGKRSLKDLTFFVDSAVLSVIQDRGYTAILDGGRITDYIK